MVNQLLISLVNSVLGSGKKTARGNMAYTCPYCHHHKPKLEVNFTVNKLVIFFDLYEFFLLL